MNPLHGTPTHRKTGALHPAHVPAAHAPAAHAPAAPPHAPGHVAAAVGAGAVAVAADVGVKAPAPAANAPTVSEADFARIGALADQAMAAKDDVSLASVENEGQMAAAQATTGKGSTAAERGAYAAIAQAEAAIDNETKAIGEQLKTVWDMGPRCDLIRKISRLGAQREALENLRTTIGGLVANPNASNDDFGAATTLCRRIGATDDPNALRDIASDVSLLATKAATGKDASPAQKAALDAIANQARALDAQIRAVAEKLKTVWDTKARCELIGELSHLSGRQGSIENLRNTVSTMGASGHASDADFRAVAGLAAQMATTRDPSALQGLENQAAMFAGKAATGKDASPAEKAAFEAIQNQGQALDRVSKDLAARLQAGADLKTRCELIRRLGEVSAQRAALDTVRNGVLQLGSSPKASDADYDKAIALAARAAASSDPANLRDVATQAALLVGKAATGKDTTPAQAAAYRAIDSQQQAIDDEQQAIGKQLLAGGSLAERMKLIERTGQLGSKLGALDGLRRTLDAMVKSPHATDGDFGQMAQLTARMGPAEGDAAMRTIQDRASQLASKAATGKAASPAQRAAYASLDGHMGELEGQSQALGRRLADTQNAPSLAERFNLLKQLSWIGHQQSTLDKLRSLIGRMGGGAA